MNNNLKYISYDRCSDVYNLIQGLNCHIFRTSGQFHVVTFQEKRGELPNPDEVFRGINYFQSKKILTKSEIIELADFCRSIIVTQANWLQFIQLVDPAKIPFTDPRFRKCVIYSMQQLLGATDEITKLLSDDILRVALFYPLMMNDLFTPFISIIRKRYPDGLFNSFSFEDSLFLIYNEEKLYDKLGFFGRFLFDYDEDVFFYVECLAGAIKTFMKTLNIEPSKKNNSRKSHLLVEQIFYEFIECYLQIQKNGGNKYFKPMIKSNDKEKVD